MAAAERHKRVNYRPVLEHDGLIWHRSQLEEKNKNKTKEEILAEERDCKRRRMSCRGKKLKRNRTEVSHDLIEGHMEEIVKAGGIGCFVKHTGGALPSTEAGRLDVLRIIVDLVKHLHCICNTNSVISATFINRRPRILMLDSILPELHQGGFSISGNDINQGYGAPPQNAGSQENYPWRMRDEAYPVPTSRSGDRSDCHMNSPWTGKPVLVATNKFTLWSLRQWYFSGSP